MLVLTNNYSDGGHSAVLRTLPFVSLNMRVCGFVTLRPNALATFLLANTSDDRRWHFAYPLDVRRNRAVRLKVKNYFFIGEENANKASNITWIENARTRILGNN